MAPDALDLELVAFGGEAHMLVEVTRADPRVAPQPRRPTLARGPLDRLQHPGAQAATAQVGACRHPPDPPVLRPGIAGVRIAHQAADRQHLPACADGREVERRGVLLRRVHRPVRRIVRAQHAEPERPSGCGVDLDHSDRFPGCAHSRAPSTGRRTRNTVRPGSESTLRLPRWRSTTIRLAVSRPRPVPRPTSLVVKDGAKIRSRASAGMPGPSPSVATSAQSPSRRAPIVILPLSPDASVALSSRVVQTWLSSAP